MYCDYTTVVLIIPVILRLCSSQNLQYPELTIDQGVLRGFNDTTSDGRQFYAFLGIPYAEPPIGKLRFMETQPPQKWDGVLNATSFRTPCISYGHFTYTTETPVTGQEDCLNLNVYTPKIPDENNLTLPMDVIVFIHGGAFMYGTANHFGPQMLLDNDVVFVTIEYRVGPLGFLSTEDEVVPGNNGLRDQVEAFKWVQKNIASFGGNPNSVTIIGNSAGGSSVHYHYLSPLSKGLFHRGFSNSGTALSNWALMEKGRQKAFKIGEDLGCPTNNSNALIECLREKPAIDIVMESKQFMGWLYNPYSPFGPTIEQWGSKPFLSADPYTLLQQGKFQHLPWMTSVASEEGLYPVAEFIASTQRLQELDTKWNEILPHLLDFNYTVKDELKTGVCSKIRNYFFGNKTIPEDTVQLVQMVGDRLFVSSAVEAAKKQASTSQASVYFYYFSHRSNQSLSNYMAHNTIYYGVSHADDLAYAINERFLNPRINENDSKMSKEMLNLIWSFAKDGKPRFTSNLTFPTVQEGLPQLRFVNIKSFDELVVTDTLSLGNTDFWFSLPFQENINLALKRDQTTSFFSNETYSVIYGIACIVLFVILFACLFICP